VVGSRGAAALREVTGVGGGIEYELLLRLFLLGEEGFRVSSWLCVCLVDVHTSLWVLKSASGGLCISWGFLGQESWEF
jgi:hypothetical protein